MGKKIVKFYQGPELNYTQGIAQGKYKDGIFFATDTNTIWLDGGLYGKPYDDSWIDDKYSKAFIQIEYPAADWHITGDYRFTFISADGTSEHIIAVLPATETRAGTMSAADKSKLDSIDAENIVYKDGDKVLSENDFTDELKEKLDSIDFSADVNTIEIIKIDGVKQVPNVTDKSIDIPITELVKDAVTEGITTAYIYQGSVNTPEELPKSGMLKGHVYNIIEKSNYGEAGVNVAWTGSEWDTLGGVFSTKELEDQFNTLIENLDSRVDKLEETDIKYGKRLDDLEDAVDLLNSDIDTKGSVLYLANTVVEEALTWEEI